MDENLHYLLHQELDGLFDPPAATGAGRGVAASAPVAAAPGSEADAAAADPGAAAATAAGQATAEASIEQTLAERLSDPKVLEALIRLLGLR